MRPILSALVLAVVLLLAAACGSTNESSDSSGAVTPVATEDTIPAPVGLGSSTPMPAGAVGALVDRFPFRRFASFEEAEQVAGYHIPRPSAKFPVANGVIWLRWFPQFNHPISPMQYTYIPLAPTSIGLTVGPAEAFDSSLSAGQAVSFGGREGWMIREDSAYVFLFDCGSVDGQPLRCQVMSPKEVGRDMTEEFIGDIR